jgi:RNA polymerase sigma factor (sigma-70 family)
MKVKYESYSDAQLTELLILEDKRAFEEVYNRYWPLLLSFAKRKLDDDDQAKDVIQEVFVRLYEKMGSLYNESLRSFLYTSVQNRILNVYSRI